MTLATSVRPSLLQSHISREQLSVLILRRARLGERDIAKLSARAVSAFIRRSR
jgi:hypothetical protein